MDKELLSGLIFAVTYTGLAVGGVPRLAIDRTGIALLGAIAMVAGGVITTGQAVSSIDISTVLLLFGMMALSAQFRLAGFYTKIARDISRTITSPERFLFTLMATSALLSSVLANDIVCLAFTPVLCATLSRASLQPAPYLIGLAVASNIGSALTVIGNPQNMLIGQVGGLGFGSYMAWSLVPVAISLILSWWVLVRMYKGRLSQSGSAGLDHASSWPEYNSHQSRKGLVLMVVMVGLFFTPIPREVTAITVAGILLCSRSLTTRSILGLVDWHLITLFIGLFIVVGGLEMFGLSGAAFGRMGLSAQGPIALTAVTVILSNIISNVPAVMLLVHQIAPGDTHAFSLLALMSTFAGNLIILGSIANLITIEQAELSGVRLGFVEHAKAGVPITFITCAVGLVWAWVTI